MVETLLPPGTSYADVYRRFRWTIPSAYNIAVDVCDRHLRALLGEAHGRVGAHSAAGAGDHADLALEPSRHQSSVE